MQLVLEEPLVLLSQPPPFPTTTNPPTSTFGSHLLPENVQLLSFAAASFGKTTNDNNTIVLRLRQLDEIDGEGVVSVLVNVSDLFIMDRIEYTLDERTIHLVDSVSVFKTPYRWTTSSSSSSSHAAAAAAPSTMLQLTPSSIHSFYLSLSSSDNNNNNNNDDDENGESEEGRRKSVRVMVIVGAISAVIASAFVVAAVTVLVKKIRSTNKVMSDQELEVQQSLLSLHSA